MQSIDDYGEFTPSVDPESSGLPGLLRAHARAREAVAAAEAALKSAKRDLAMIENDHLPRTLHTLLVTAIDVDGHRIELKTDVHANVTVDRRPAMLEWLEENGHGGLIKTQVEVSFGRGAVERAADLEKSLRSIYEDVCSKRWVESQSLGRFVREIYDRGETLPADIFAVHVGETCKVSKLKTGSHQRGRSAEGDSVNAEG